jgi:uncharacterized protein (TIRG00374 family)
MKPILRLLILAAGLGLFFWYFHQIGFGEVWQMLRRLGPWAPLVLGPYFLVYLTDTAGWALSFAQGKPVSYLKLFRIRWSGEAVNNILPTAYVGGEAVKIQLLRKAGVSGQHAAAAAIVSKSSQTLAQLVFLVLAAAVFYQMPPAIPGFKTGMAVVVLGGCGVVGLIFWVQRHGILRTITRVAELLRLPWTRLTSDRERWMRVDRDVLGYYKNHPGRFMAATGTFFAGWMLDTVELYLVGHLLQMPVAWSEAFAIEAFIGVAKIMGLWVPGALGVQESGIVLLCRAAGLPDALGVAYALLRRTRELLYATVGWGLLHLKKK